MTPLPIQQRIVSTPPPPPPLPTVISSSASCGGSDEPNGTEDNLQCTPQHKSRQQQMIPQSAPPPNSRRTQMLLTSPAAVKRSNESLEAIRVAQTLKAGFSRLKARADSQNSSSSSVPLSQRAFSATSPAPVTPARRQLLYRHHSSISFSRGSPASADNMLRPSRGVPLSREPSEPVVSPSLRPLHPPYSCPQRKQSFREHHHQPSLLFPAPRFSLERAQSAASSTSAAMHSPPPSLGSSKRANKEIAEAAETMILFMRDSPTQSEERRAMLRPSDSSPSSPTFGPPHIMLPAPQRTSLEYCPADLAPQTTGEDTPVLHNDDIESEDEYAPLPSTSTASMSRLSIKRSRTDHSSSSSSGTGPPLPSKRVNIGH